jgi:hypothetical protein
MRALKTIGCAAAFIVALASGARADEWNKKTILTFSGAVQIPGATLPAGSYVFKLADIPGNRHVVQVFDKDEKKLYTTMLAIPNDRMEPSDNPVVLFSERSSGSPQAVKVWYYPGDRIGNEFVYPKSQAMRIAKETRQSVLAMNDDAISPGTAGEIPSSMRSAELGRFDEAGNWQSDNKAVAVSGNAASSTASNTASNTAGTQPTTAERAATAGQTRTMTTPAPTTGQADTASTRSTTASARSNAEGQPTGTAGARAPRTSLPKTASGLALYQLLSGLALAGGLAARRLRRR